jgi:hypothetical protein
MKPRSVCSSVARFKLDESRTQPDRRQMISNHSGSQFSTLQRHQHSAASEGINERRGVPN